MYSTTLGLHHFVKRAVTENLRLKLIAGLIALVLVVLVRVQEEVERFVYVPLVLAEGPFPKDLVLTSKIPETVRVRLRGPSTRIETLRDEDIPQVEINLSKYTAGTTDFAFYEKMFKIPNGLKFVDVTPESLPITVEKVVSRVLPVHISTIGQLKPGAEFVEKPRVSPEEVTVTGPASVVRGLKFVETDDVDIEGLGEVQFSSRVSAKRIEGAEILRGDDLRVTLDIRWIPGQRIISDLPVRAGPTELAIELNPKKATITLAGPQIILDKLDLSTVVPLVEIDDEQLMLSETVKSEIKVRGIPEDIKVTSIVPEKIRVGLIQPKTAKKRKIGVTAQKSE